MRNSGKQARLVVRALALFGAAMLSACGETTPAGGRDAGTPFRFDAGVTQDAGNPGPTPDGGVIDRAGQCGAYCNKLFDCGYFPRPDSPPGYSRASCIENCTALGGFPPQSRRECVATATCDCDGGGCHSVDSCFTSIVDGGP